METWNKNYCTMTLIGIHQNISPIAIFKFIDVKTTETIELGECFYDQEASKIFGGKFYMDIINATGDYDIIWKAIDQGITISPAAKNFEEVQLECLRMLDEGANPEDINQSVIKIFENKARTFRIPKSEGNDKSRQSRND